MSSEERNAEKTPAVFLATKKIGLAPRKKRHEHKAKKEKKSRREIERAAGGSTETYLVLFNADREEVGLAVPEKGLSDEHADCIRRLCGDYILCDKGFHATYDDLSPELGALFNEWIDAGIVPLADPPLTAASADLFVDATDTGKTFRGSRAFKDACRRMIGAVYGIDG